MSGESESEELGAVSRAREGVQAARRLLLRPGAASLEQGAAHIESAVASLRGFRRFPGAASELAALRKEVTLAAALVEGAAAFYLGWARLLFAATGGYTAQGEPAPPGPVRRVSVEG